MVLPHQLAPGLWRWTALHPGWRPGTPDQEVGSYALETPDGLVLVDPLAPGPESDEADAFWSWLDPLVRGAGRPIWVLLTLAAHVRSSAALLARYGPTPGGAVWGPPAAAAALPADVPFVDVRSAGRLPAGIHALDAVDAAEETPLVLPEQDALVVGDLLAVRPDGLRVWYWYDDEAGRRRYRSEYLPVLRRLLDPPPARLLVTHGAPVLEGTAQALEEALERPPMTPSRGEVPL